MNQLRFYVLCLALLVGNVNLTSNKSKYGTVADGCFCKLKGEVDDCSCKVESLDSLNNQKIYPRLQSLLTRDYFRYFKVNLHKKCPFWPDDMRCAMKNCAVDVCTEDQLPESFKGADGSIFKPSKQAQDEGSCEEDKMGPKPKDEDSCEEERLGYLNTTISDKSREAFQNWTKYDDAQETFCEIDDDSSTDCNYVDLMLNPERYTGYKGMSPHRIWKSIYEENCFSPDVPGYGVHASQSLAGMCLEKRAFYRMVSGLHTSINIHLCAGYLFPASTCYGRDEWKMNVEEFRNRFEPTETNGMGPVWLKNLYFTYLVELRALAKAAPYLQEEKYFTGNGVEDKDLQAGIKDLLDIVKSFPDHFDESKLFQGNKKEAKILKEEFRNHFLNISRIMDCVGCDKCKLWGKLQVQGMGTALKILFSGDGMGPTSIVTAKSKKSFQLRRTEIVSLINAFGRLSSSIHTIEEFRKRL